MDLLGIESEFDIVARSCCRTGINSCGDGELFEIEIQEYFCTKKLVNPYRRLEYAIRILILKLIDHLLGIIYILRTDTEGNGLSVIAAVDQLLGLLSRKYDRLACYL